MRVLSTSQMVALEKEANQKGLSYEEMMARAGRGLAEIVYQDFFSKKRQKVLGLVGGGNNGGDTLVALAYLAKKGWKAQAYIVKERNPNDPLISALLREGGEIIDAVDDASYSILKKWVKNADIILDGILGTGAKLPLRTEISQILKNVKLAQSAAKVVAVDCPSGVDCDSGEAPEECMKADLTVCMAAVKVGLLKMPAFEFVGKIKVVDIGLPKSLPTWKQINGDVLCEKCLQRLMPKRRMDSHKGSFGTTIIVGGSINYCGAVLLASKGAYRVGAGLVRAAIPNAIYDALCGQLPEATWIVLPQVDGAIRREAAPLLFDNLKRSSALLIGPGLGLHKETQLFFECLIEELWKGWKIKRGMGFRDTLQEEVENLDFPPLVIDADGLKLLAGIDMWYEKLPKNSVLTPHPGEMSVISGIPIDEIQKDRIGVAKDYASQWGHIVVLKGALTVIAAPHGDFAVVPIATSALATAGTGDVLAGMVAGFLSQGLDAYSAAKIGAFIHAKAGVIAAEKLGGEAPVMAGDVADAIPEALKSITDI